MKLVVLGGGESGVGAALLGRHLGYEVFLSDKGKLAESYRDELITHRIAFEEGQHSMDRIFAAELVVKSPGIPDTVPMVVALRERGIEVISEIEFAGRHTEAKMVCITGHRRPDLPQGRAGRVGLRAAPRHHRRGGRPDPPRRYRGAPQ